VILKSCVGTENTAGMNSRQDGEQRVAMAVGDTFAMHIKKFQQESGGKGQPFSLFKYMQS